MMRLNNNCFKAIQSAILFRNIWMITPNKKEAEMLTGITITNDASVEKAALALREKGVAIVIITLGAKGAFIAAENIMKC